MTVKQLISKLKNHNQDAIVWLEGCDCTNEARDVEAGIDESEQSAYANGKRDKTVPTITITI